VCRYVELCEGFDDWNMEDDLGGVSYADEEEPWINEVRSDEFDWGVSVPQCMSAFPDFYLNRMSTDLMQIILRMIDLERSTAGALI
jgi:hypothetical protein